MSRVGTFNYPGGKTTIANWIIEKIPEHEVYVEPFGGSAGVLANKPESPLEVYNDVASLCVDFFRAVKHHPDELQRWLQTTPYSRELFNEYVERLQNNPHDSIVERAGMFWYTQSISFGGKGVVNDKTPSFGTVTSPYDGGTHRVSKHRVSVDNLDRLLDRFRTVEVEHLDFKAVFEKYDSPDTFFYCDPPYMDVGDNYYTVEDGGFNHERFVDALHDLEGKWMVSYDHNIPDGLEDYTVVSRGKHSNLGNKNGKKTETLVMNYDVEGERVMSELGQQGLGDYS